MNHYSRRFMVASLLYLMLGAAMGFLMTVEGPNSTVFRFMHIHFLFLGFMVMLMAGVAYHFLPILRNGGMRWPRLVPVHFYMANIGLAGKCIAYLLESKIGFIPFALFASVTVISLSLFAINLVASIPTQGAMLERANKQREDDRLDERVRAITTKAA